jgi:hypothetical protein
MEEALQGSQTFPELKDDGRKMRLESKKNDSFAKQREKVILSKRTSLD